MQDMSTGNADDSKASPYCSAKPERYLSGYLNKLSHKGLIRSWKKRWIIYHDPTCQLRCFASSQDSEPLEVISIRDAVFSFDSSKERQHVFKIMSAGQECFLEAPSDEICFNWLLFLQKSRRSYSLRRTENLRTNVVGFDRSPPESGLLGSGGSNDPSARVKTEEATSEKPLSKNKNSYSNVKKQVINALKSRSSFPSSDGDPSTSSTSRPASAISLGHKKTSSEAGFPPDVPQGRRSPRKQSFRSKFRFSKDDSATECLSASCQRCISLQEEIDLLKSDKANIEEELLAGQEVIQILQQHMSTVAAERDTADNLLYLSYGNDTKVLLADRDRKIVELEFTIAKQESAITVLQEEKSALETDQSNYTEQVAMLKDLLSAKDEAIMMLTNKIFDLEDGEHKFIGKTACDRKSFCDVPSEKPLDISVECIQMQDSIDAYKFQNQFLNSEIVELHVLIEDANMREEKLSGLSSNWEAKYCQVQSKYLLLLKELHAPKPDTEESMSLVSQLVQDALAEDAKNQASYLSSTSGSSTSRYDELGFNKTWGIEDDVFAQRAQKLKVRSKCLNESLQTSDYDQWMSKWDNFMLSVGSKDIQKNLELKLMIRTGIPHKHRGTIWKRCVDLKIGNIRARLKPNYYHSLLASHTNVSKLDPFVKQIELDLLRTLPNNKHYESMHSDGIPRLRRILLAFSWHNPSVGYCQGINRLVAIALLYLEEEDAFWCLVAIIEKIMPVDYYSKTLITSQVDQRVLKDLMQEKLPRLNAHLEAHNVDLSLVTFTWLLTVFVDNIPVKTYLKIWDSFLYEGSKVLFRYTLAIFKYTEDELLRLQDYIAINMYLRGITQTLDDVKAISQIAFNGLQSFSMRSIASKRTHHMQIVRRELEALEAIRSSDLAEDKEDSGSDYD